MDNIIKINTKIIFKHLKIQSIFENSYFTPLFSQILQSKNIILEYNNGGKLLPLWNVKREL